MRRPPTEIGLLRILPNLRPPAALGPCWFIGPKATLTPLALELLAHGIATVVLQALVEPLTGSKRGHTRNIRGQLTLWQRCFTWGKACVVCKPHAERAVFQAKTRKPFSGDTGDIANTSAICIRHQLSAGLSAQWSSRRGTPRFLVRLLPLGEGLYPTRTCSSAGRERGAKLYPEGMTANGFQSTLLM